MLLTLRFDEGDYPDGIEEALRLEGCEVFTGDSEVTREATRQLSEYTAGVRRELTVPLELRGTGWQRESWAALGRIPFGETRTYAEVAATLGRPGSARAVGSANARNRLPLVVPCHRVVGADGRLTGFAGGIHLKERLLAHEQRVLSKERNGS